MAFVDYMKQFSMWDKRMKKDKIQVVHTVKKIFCRLQMCFMWYALNELAYSSMGMI